MRLKRKIYGEHKDYLAAFHRNKGVHMVVGMMTGKEVVNLIQKLEEEGMSAEKIIEIIKYVETAEPRIETK